MKRRDFLRGMIASGLAVGAGPTMPVKAADTPKPNILFILVDDLGYGDLSSYGAKDLHTPHIDGLMKAGMRFDSFYANCPVCSPTRASAMSGCYPDIVGVPGVIRTHSENSWGYFAPDVVTTPTLLKKAGYRTACVGKWHLGLDAASHPNRRSFDSFQGFLGDMMDDYYTHRRHGNNYMFHDEEEIDPEGHATDLFSQWASDTIRETGRKRDAAPFFLYLAYNAPHTPIQPPKEWLEKVKAREAGITDRRAKLVALIEHMDAGIGQVLQALKEAGLEKNTLILFTSDNGGQDDAGADNGDLRGAKQNMYEGGIRVPMCAVWPGRIQAGSRSDRVALTMDLVPTFCDVAGVKIEHEIDGRSIWPILKGEDMPELAERTLFWVRREGGQRYGGRAYYAARRGDWKLLQNTPWEPMRLFNLKDDPKETTPLPDSHPMYKELSTALRHHIIRSGYVPWRR